LPFYFLRSHCSFLIGYCHLLSFLLIKIFDTQQSQWRQHSCLLYNVRVKIPSFFTYDTVLSTTLSNIFPFTRKSKPNKYTIKLKISKELNTHSSKFLALDLSAHIHPFGVSLCKTKGNQNLQEIPKEDNPKYKQPKISNIQETTENFQHTRKVQRISNAD